MAKTRTVKLDENVYTLWRTFKCWATNRSTCGDLWGSGVGELSRPQEAFDRKLLVQFLPHVHHRLGSWDAIPLKLDIVGLLSCDGYRAPYPNFVPPPRATPVTASLEKVLWKGTRHRINSWCLDSICDL